MSRLHDLERRIDETLRGMLRSSSPNQKRELLEIHRALLDDVAAHVDTLRRAALMCTTEAFLPGRHRRS